MTPVLLVGVGGIAGALARHAIGERFANGRAGTFFVNVTGSFLLGVFLAAPLGELALASLGTGFCGAFTTFSTFSFETIRLAETGRPAQALGNAGLTLITSVFAVWMGLVSPTIIL